MKTWGFLILKIFTRFSAFFHFVDINQARFEFLVDANASLDNYTLARENRQAEIDHIINFFDYYEQLKDITGEELDSSAFFDKAKMQDILGVDANGNDDPTKTDILTNMLAEIEETYCFNLLTIQRRSSDDELSLFESLMLSLMDQSGLKELADVPETDHTTMEHRIIKISDCEIDGLINADGYNSSWIVRDGSGEIIGGECASITGVLKSIVGVASGTSIDANELSMTAIQASKITNVMKAVNDSYLCTGVMKHFIKEAFSGGMGLESLLKYDSSDTEMVANFDLDYIDYGGENNECLEGTEIYSLYKVLDGMQFENSSGEYEFVSLDDLQASLASKPDCLDGVFYFLFNSAILEEEYEGNANIKGRDILLYNALKNFDSYLIGGDKENKILSLEKLFEIAKSIYLQAFNINLDISASCGDSSIISTCKQLNKFLTLSNVCELFAATICGSSFNSVKALLSEILSGQYANEISSPNKFVK